jgi:small GTP-binding protein
MMLGDASVPKTSLTIRYISGFFLEDLKLTIGVDFYSKTTIINGKKVKLQIWDFGGEERFRFLLSQYCKGANAAMFLYDITNPLTLEHLPDWTQIIREHAGNIPIMLVGSKLDLEEFRAVPREEGIRVAEKYQLSSFVEVSAKTGHNVHNAFQTLAEILMEKYNKGRISEFRLLVDLNNQIDRLMNLYMKWGRKYTRDNPAYVTDIQKVLKTMNSIKVGNKSKFDNLQLNLKYKNKILNKVKI